jgi:DNA-binding transcriptional ArsR family regulator
MTEDELDLLFQALAHVHRRRMLDVIAARPGLAVGELAQHFDVSRIAVMNHLAVLERAGLVLATRDGRARRLFFNAVPIQQVHDRWTDQYSAGWASRLTRIKATAEHTAAQGPHEDD